jgi:hypothetical protein
MVIPSILQNVFTSMHTCKMLGYVREIASAMCYLPNLHLMIKALIHKVQPEGELLGWSTLSPKKPILSLLVGSSPTQGGYP